MMEKREAEAWAERMLEFFLRNPGSLNLSSRAVIGSDKAFR